MARVKLTTGLDNPAAEKTENETKPTGNERGEYVELADELGGSVVPIESKGTDLDPRDTAPVGPQRKKKPAQKRGASDTRVDLGVYMTAEQFDAMRGAYLADFLNGGEANTLYLWVADALSTHARRSAKDRIANSRIRDRATTGGRAETTKTKAFKIPEGVVSDMRAGIAEDRKAGRWATESAWAGEAISRAVEQAREKNGGSLPEPPARLPNRLKR